MGITVGANALAQDDAEPCDSVAQVTVFGKLAARSSKMKLALAALERVAATGRSLLIEGETGVGKEVAAECVHRSSSRARGPFRVFDCAAKSPTVSEWELFGLEREACSRMPVPGTLELANGGSILFDHLDELALPLQQRLLRALKRRELTRVGGIRTVALDLRVMAASSRSLQRATRLGLFNRELLAHMSAACVQIPPLRCRREDLSFLSRELLAELKPPRESGEISEELWAAFQVYDWPGNVRELRNALSLALLAPERVLRLLRGSAELGPCAVPLGRSRRRQRTRTA